MNLIQSCCSTLLMLFLANLAHAEGAVIKRIGDEKSRISSAIWVGDTLYLQGMLATPVMPSDPAKGTRPIIDGDTKTQTISTLNAIQKALREQGLDVGDVIQMRIYLVGDPALGGKMDFAGFNAAYDQFFGTKEQPNKPVRATMQITALAFATGLVEIEVVAARGTKAK